MGLFGKSRERASDAAQVRLPGGFAQFLEHYGRWEFDPQDSRLTPPQIDGQPADAVLYFLAEGKHDAFISAVAAVALPAGGWALYGGARVVWNAVGSRVEHPDYLAMLDGAIDFVLAQGYGIAHLKAYEIRRLSQTRDEASAQLPQS